MKAIIIEDESKNRDVLTFLLSTYCPDVAVLAQAETVKESIPLIRSIQPDIVFLDIILPDENGFDLLSYFNPINFSIIFTTAYEKYAIQAIRANACDYLLKPINHKELILAVEKAKKIKSSAESSHSDHRDNNIIRIPTMNGFRLCNTNDILYCKADGRYTNFYFSDGDILISSKNLGDYESNLADSRIIRVSRSYAVNIYKIAEYFKGKVPYVILQNNKSINVTQQYKEPFLHAIKSS